jgi:hypothetical protein
MTTNNTRFSRGKWDKENSTYMQIVQFKSGRSLAGFSKKIDFHERNDKVSLLTNWILRMLRDGYLDPSNTRVDPIECIEYYEVVTGEHLFNARYHTVEIISENMYESEYYKPILKFLEIMYALIDQGKSAAKIYEKLYVRSRQKTFDPLDHTKKRFMNIGMLSKYAQDLVETGKAEVGAVENFVVKYSEMHFNATPTIKRSGESMRIDKLIKR